MTARHETTSPCPRPVPFHDAEQTLLDLALLEADLEREMDRLRNLRAPSKPGMARYMGRDIWWWRSKLVEWAYSPHTERAHPTGVLAGLKLVLHEFSDRDLVVFLDMVLRRPDESTAA